MLYKIFIIPGFKRPKVIKRHNGAKGMTEVTKELRDMAT